MRIFLNEGQIKYILPYLFENVYVNDIDRKKKTAQLTYNKLTRNAGIKNSQDYLKTDKMNTQNADTYEVTLKGGIVCYNITSIKGEDVMHYFKNKWGNNKDAKIKFKNSETNEIEDYDLTMMSDEEKAFFNDFTQKVGFVVRHSVSNFKKIDQNFLFNGISIYPVPSSSNFNLKMANLLSKSGLYGMPVQVINTNILKKNLDNIERDEEFINKNKEFYDSNFYKQGGDKKSVNAHLDKTLNKMRGIRKAQENIPLINELVKSLISKITNYHTAQKIQRKTTVAIRNMVETYKRYYNLLCETIMLSKYENALTSSESKSHSNKIFKTLKYSKGPSIEGRSDELWSIVKPYLRGEISPVTKKPYKQIELVFLEKVPFEIKNFTNGERMGLKNMYTQNTNEKDIEMVQQELEKIKGTIFLIFDDNISGGATLSDICYQCKKMGIENIIPITFGEMNEKWTLNVLPLNSPEINNGHAKWNY